MHHSREDEIYDALLMWATTVAVTLSGLCIAALAAIEISRWF